MAIRINQREIPETVIEAKRWWREKIRRALNDTSAGYRASASEAITRGVLSIIDGLNEYSLQAAMEGGIAASLGFSRGIDTVMVYYPVGKEIDTRALIEELLAQRKTVCLPLCTDIGEDGKRKEGLSQMEARRIRSLDDLVPGAYGIPEPSKDAPLIRPRDIDLIVMPCLSCDTECGRIGHGAGYYDNFLSKTKDDCVTMAVCYDAVLSPYPLPAEPHDKQVDLVVTEKMTYRNDDSVLVFC